MAEEKHGKRGPATQPVVLQALLDRRGEVVHIKAIEKATGLTRVQVQNAAVRLVRAHPGVEVVQLGNAWRYDPDRDNEPESTKDNGDKHVYQQVGTAGNGDHVIEDETGMLYRAQPL